MELELLFWHWWLLGLALLLVERFARTGLFLWMSVASGLLGVALFLAPKMGLEYQFFFFAIFSIVASAAWKYYKKTAAG
ncbi:MAG: hypothetical protein PVG75_11075 [Thioalkalispiraceae bacterium]|jgi:membrane protein implicated in regulation of membrane protease activity